MHLLSHTLQTNTSRDILSVSNLLNTLYGILFRYKISQQWAHFLNFNLFFDKNMTSSYKIIAV